MVRIQKDVQRSKTGIQESNNRTHVYIQVKSPFCGLNVFMLQMRLHVILTRRYYIIRKCKNSTSFSKMKVSEAPLIIFFFSCSSPRLLSYVLKLKFLKICPYSSFFPFVFMFILPFCCLMFRNESY